MASGRTRYRLTVGRLMGLIAALAALLAAGIYRWENLDVDRAASSASLDALRRGDVAARLRAAGALGDAGLARPEVLTGLVEAAAGDGPAEVRAAAIAALGALGADPASVRAGWPRKPVPPLDRELSPIRAVIRGLDDPEPAVRRAAVGVLARFHPHLRLAPDLAGSALAALDRRLADADPAVREAAVGCLDRLAAPPAGARGRFLALIASDPAPAVRLAAMGALVRHWPAAELYPILLARRSAAPTAGERAAILAELGQNTAPPPGESIPTLLDLMAGDEAGATYVPFMLGPLGAGARPYLGALARLAARELRGDPIGPCSAIQVLAQLDPTAPEAQAVVIPLARRLRDATADQLPHLQLAWLLAKFGPAAAPAVPTLREALRNPTGPIRADAADLLGGLDAAAAPAIADLETLGRDDPDPAVRAAAARALEKLRPAAATSTP